MASTKRPLGEYTMELAYILVDPNSCGGSIMCMLSGVASSGLAPAELAHNNSTVEPGCSAQYCPALGTNC